jgi:hypothetical protein
MNDRNQRLSADEIEALLPWYAAGTLDAQEAGQVEAALAANTELARRLDLVREEMTEAIVLNEALGVPSARVAEKLFSAIDRERRAVRHPAAGGGFAGWLANLVSPRTYAFAGAAAVLLIALEAGVIARLALQDQGQPATYTPQELNRTRSIEIGAFAYVKFSPQASMADVTRFLDGRDAEIMAGPDRSGQYRVRIGRNNVQKEELDRLAKEFQAASSLVIAAISSE